MRVFWRVLERRFEEVACAVLLLAMAFLIFTQVVMRYVFRSPLSWSDELAIYAMVWLVYLGASLAVREGAHIRVLNAILAAPGKGPYVLCVVSDALWLLVNVSMIWQGLVLEGSFWERRFLSPALGIDQKWPYLIVPLGFLLMSLRLGQLYWRWWRHGEPPLERVAEASDKAKGRGQ